MSAKICLLTSSTNKPLYHIIIMKKEVNMQNIISQKETTIFTWFTQSLGYIHQTFLYCINYSRSRMPQHSCCHTFAIHFGKFSRENTSCSANRNNLYMTVKNSSLYLWNILLEEKLYSLASYFCNLSTVKQNMVLWYTTIKA